MRQGLLVIDLQKAVFGTTPLPAVHDAPALERNARRLIDAARASGTPVFYIQHCASPGEFLEKGAPGWPIHAPLAPLDGEAVVEKYASDAFEDTRLHEVLRAQGIDHLVLCGIQSEHCVTNTCRGALAHDYTVTVASDAHSTWPHDGLDAAQWIAKQNDLLRADAQVRPTEDIVASLSSSAA